MKVLFLIPARGGSKGIEGKNLRTVGGIPLVGRSARTANLTAVRLGFRSRIVCSTDCQEIAAAAKAWGAEVPFLRPAGLAGDAAPTIDVVRHALKTLGDSFDAVVLLQPTSPLTSPDDVTGALELFTCGRGPVVSVCMTEHPLEWTYRMSDRALLVAVIPGLTPHQRQGTPPAYRLNGAIYVASPMDVQEGGFLGSQTRGFVMPTGRSIDIDTTEDLDLLRSLVTGRPHDRVEIAGRCLGRGEPALVIAEAGVNHNGSPEVALRLIDAAVAAGADAVKFQSFRAEKVLTRDAPKAAYQKRNTGTNESQFEMVSRLELDEETHRRLVRYCADAGIVFLSTPFDQESADLLESLGVPAFKLSSGEITNTPLLRHVARKQRPIVLSTGMSTLQEVAGAVDTIRSESSAGLILLQCVSNYPADPADVNLRAMASMREAFSVPVGYSDHTMGNDVCLAAVAMGACVIEKHFTLDRGLPGPDHLASAEPSELAGLVRSIRTVESARGDGIKRPALSEADTKLVARRSLVAAQSIPQGAVIEEEMLTARRPGGGISPAHSATVVGRRARCVIPEGKVLRSEMFE